LNHGWTLVKRGAYRNIMIWLKIEVLNTENSIFRLHEQFERISYYIFRLLILIFAIDKIILYFINKRRIKEK